jgi:hypothetical protein
MYVPDWTRPILGVVALAASWAALSFGFWPAAHLALLAGLLLCAAAALPGAWWPLPLVAALVGYEVAGRGFPSLRRPTSWLQAGRITTGTWVLIVGIAAISGVALVVWAATADPDWQRYRSNFPDLPRPVLILGALAFSVVNAAAEEAAFRGVVQGVLGEAIGVRAAHLVQAAAFGLLHIQGFPSGFPGVLLATTYGLALGALRSHTGGLLAPWLAHIAADVVIVSVLLFVLFP